jgi:replicative superfamily II helicase
MLVTTPEKWDVVTRKSSGDIALTQIVKLLIIDEVHLLHDERGSVIECLVARTLRQVIVSLCLVYNTHVKISQLVNKMCSQCQACSKLVNKL